MTEIKLTRGFMARVDDADHAWLRQYIWHATQDKNGNLYAQRSERVNGKQIKLIMGRMITNAPKGSVVKYRDGDTLNNQRANLVVMTRNGKKQIL